MSTLEISEITILPTGHATNAERCAAFHDALDVPIAPIPDHRRDYIDWLRHEDVPHHAIKGRDVFGRRFIAFRLECGYEGEDPEKIVAVAHERYANRQDLWVMAGGGGYTDKPLGFPIPDIDGIKQLLTAKEIRREEYGMVCKIRLI